MDQCGGQILIFPFFVFSRLIFSSSYYCIGTLVDGADLKFKKKHRLLKLAQTKSNLHEIYFEWQWKHKRIIKLRNIWITLIKNPLNFEQNLIWSLHRTFISVDHEDRGQKKVKMRFLINILIDFRDYKIKVNLENLEDHTICGRFCEQIRNNLKELKSLYGPREFTLAVKNLR